MDNTLPPSQGNNVIYLPERRYTNTNTGCLINFTEQNIEIILGKDKDSERQGRIINLIDRLLEGKTGHLTGDVISTIEKYCETIQFNGIMGCSYSVALVKVACFIKEKGNIGNLGNICILIGILLWKYTLDDTYKSNITLPEDAEKLRKFIENECKGYKSCYDILSKIGSLLKNLE